VGEAENLIVLTRDHCEGGLLRFSQSAAPHCLAIGNDVPVKVGIRVRTSVVTSPAVGMEGGDGVGIATAGVEILHGDNKLLRHGDLLIDPGFGTVREPAAGPSKGQIPQVALDERAETIRRSSKLSVESGPVAFPAFGDTRTFRQQQRANPTRLRSACSVKS
jgi:hypothetical protein